MIFQKGKYEQRTLAMRRGAVVMNETVFYVEGSCPYLGKCVRMSVRFSGSSLSFSTLNFSRSWRRVTVKMDLSKLRPNT